METEELMPIEEVARQLGLRASAIRYYEECGLVDAVSRRSGRRWYGSVEIRRLAIIRFWQTSGLMSLSEIREILEGDDADRPWPQIMGERISALSSQIEQMQHAKQFLQHVLSEHADTAPDGCAHYEALIFGEGLDHHHHHHHQSDGENGPLRP